MLLGPAIALVDLASTCVARCCAFAARLRTVVRSTQRCQVVVAVIVTVSHVVDIRGRLATPHAGFVGVRASVAVPAQDALAPIGPVGRQALTSV